MLKQIIKYIEPSDNLRLRQGATDRTILRTEPLVRLSHRPKMKPKVRKVCLMGLLYVFSKIIKRKRQPKRWWVRNIFLNRKGQGSFHNLLEEMRLTDTEKYFNYLRMSPIQFEELLSLVGPDINRLNISREPINSAQRLACTLR